MFFQQKTECFWKFLLKTFFYKAYEKTKLQVCSFELLNFIRWILLWESFDEILSGHCINWQ